ncbi:hypothetical protein ENSA7_01180 [Enhygromyxa salina]|uniref:Uncharacterized protein n=1 Tax=Enhygromyxa salina TaxID=215803 RepID=A0A2S9YYN5_9BACT|nr:hypothetical protein ENSA7_01180 [Enhygromyxa salina]
MTDSSAKTTLVPDTIASRLPLDSHEARAAGRHNSLHLLLAALGVVMLGTALLDWLIHPVTLWAGLP